MDGRLGLLLAPFAQSDRPGGARQLCSDLDPLCDFEGIVDLDAKVADGTFDAGVAEQKLHRTQVPRAAVDQGRFGSTHGMRRIFEPVEANGRRCPRNRREDRGLNYRGRAAVLRPGGRSGQKVA